MRNLPHGQTMHRWKNVIGCVSRIEIWIGIVTLAQQHNSSIQNLRHGRILYAWKNIIGCVSSLGLEIQIGIFARARQHDSSIQNLPRGGQHTGGKTCVLWDGLRRMTDSTQNVVLEERGS